MGLLSDIVKKKTLAERYLELYDAHVMEKIFNNSQKRRSKVFHPSEICKTECPLQLVYMYHGLAPVVPDSYKPNAFSARNFDHGHNAHRRIQDNYIAMKISREDLIEKEVWSPEYNIYGHCDGIIYIDEWEVVVDIKTIKAKNFYALKFSGIKPEHKIQLMLYMHFLNIKYGLIVYENKDNLVPLPLEVEYNFNVIKPVLDNCKIALDIINGGKHQITCQNVSCGYIKYCRKEYN